MTGLQKHAADNVDRLAEIAHTLHVAFDASDGLGKDDMILSAWGAINDMMHEECEIACSCLYDEGGEDDR